MQLRILVEAQQGATYEQLVAAARTAERYGFDAFFRSDHVLRIGGGDPGAGATEAFASLAGLARDTTVIRLGTMVTPASFRLPGMLAVTAATLDAMSNGRFELGLGAGWYVREHEAFGIPFHPTAERFAHLTETLEILTGLWATAPGDTFSYAGSRYRLRDVPNLPRPVQHPRIPLIVGGTGPNRTVRLAARHADEYNAVRSGYARAKALFDGVRRACDQIDRDPGSLRYSVVHTAIVGQDKREVAQLLALTGRSAQDLADGSGVAGSPEQVVEDLRALQRLGVDRVYLQLKEAALFDQIAALGEQVLPHVNSAAHS